MTATAETLTPTIASRSEPGPDDNASIAGIPLRRLPPAARREFEAIVGSRDVSEDPTLCASYAWCFAGGITPGTPERMISTILPVAVMLPESTEEVAAVIKTCLRHGLKYRPHSTGVGSYPNVDSERAIIIDLRKMSRLTIDVKNQMAVIEPYVTGQQLTVEAMKVGLMSHIIGAGWTTSPLASATSFGGVGPSGNHTGSNNRNLLAMEWVTPEGEIVRLGTAGHGDDWFAGEGPGPGFRGMIRGVLGAAGELGVFTRIGYKLHPWMGPPRLEHVGRSPQVGIKLPDTMRIYQLVWKDWQVMADATHALLHADCATFIDRVPPDHIGYLLYPTNREFYEAWTSNKVEPVMHPDNGYSWTVMTISENVAEAEWRERTIHRIVADHQGKIVPVRQDHAEVLARNLITSCYVPRIYRVAPRGIMTSLGHLDTPSVLPQIMETAENVTRPYKEKYGAICGGRVEQTWMWTAEGRFLWGENVVTADNDRTKSWADMMTFVVDIVRSHDEKPLGYNLLVATTPIVDTFGHHFGANLWMRRIKMLFDPTKASDGMMMPFGPISPLRRIWPMVRFMLVHMPSLFRLAVHQQLKASIRARLKRVAARRRS